ncbi:hypothetical protein, partial [Bradyrhizobium liaoningense]|uniref:hypothetical protein n=1 Tax=Bradyrhizobium liaoningense TaxID=43992 RepID=UPI001AEC1D21
MTRVELHADDAQPDNHGRRRTKRNPVLRVRENLATALSTDEWSSQLKMGTSSFTSGAAGRIVAG